MKKVLNTVLSILKIILLIVSFILTFYITMVMYQRLEKNFLEAIDIFIPYFILLVLLLLNHILGQKHVTSNIFYNITCCLVFSLFIFVSYRTMFDNYMILSLKNSHNMSFYYFSDMIQPLKALLYLLIGANVCLIINDIISKKEAVSVKREEVKEKISVEKNDVKTSKNNKNNGTVKNNKTSKKSNSKNK